MAPTPVLSRSVATRESSRARWVRNYDRLSERVKRRLVLESDDTSFSASDALEIHRLTGVPLIFDHQHFWCLNPERLELRPTVEAFLRNLAFQSEAKAPLLLTSDGTPRNSTQESPDQEDGNRAPATIAQGPC